MTAFIDVQLIEGLGLPYVEGAEAALLDAGFDPIFNDAWQAFVAGFPGQTLTPLFNNVPIEQLADLVDGVRVNGDEPPNPFLWFTLSCDDSEVDAIIAALQALPMVNLAEQRLEGVPAATISYGTNPDAVITPQIQPSPVGVDAIYAWQVAGGPGEGAHIADIEGGWRLDHDELVAARIRRISVIGSRLVDHGTAVAGIVVGSDNGVGTIGIVPDAEFGLITDNRGPAIGNNIAASIMLAIAQLEAGDILLIELALPFVPGNAPEVFVEFNRSVQIAIGLATGRGITVIEPAGNGGKNLDAFGFLAHTQPGSPSFFNSGAVVVGAGEFNLVTNTWTRATFSSFGSRVDCFADGLRVRAPSSAGTNTYQFFSGTSAASAIIAGMAGSIQSMTRAKGNGVLLPADVRRLLSSALLGTLPENPLAARVGSMPDLRRITRAQGLMRILPVGAALIGGDALILVHLDADNRIVRRQFTFFTGWGPPIPTPTLDGSPSPSDSFELTAAQPAVTSSDEVDPIDRLVFDAFFSRRGEIHHMFWDSRNQSGDVSKAIVPTASVADGRAPAALRPLINVVVLSAINPEGRLVVFTGDPQILLSAMSAPLVLDVIGRYRRVAGPTIVSRSAGLVDIVTIEDGGSLNWFTGNVTATVGSGFSGPVTDLSGTQFDPGARPAVIVTGNLLLAVAVRSDGSLRAITINPVTRTIAAPVEIDDSVSIDTFGPVALGRTALSVVALAVDKQGTVRAATRAIGGGNWTPLLPLLSPGKMSSLGGVTAVSIDLGVMAIAVTVEGIVCSAISVDGLIWSPLVPLP
jgi:hypothetical protein